MKKFTDQEIDTALKAAPKVIQEKIAEPSEMASIIRTIKSKYNLHIDMLGVVAELTRNMLLGLVNPQECLQELITTGIPEKDAEEIITEINQKIFVPLREELRRPAGSESRPQASGMQNGPAPAVQPTRPPAPVNARVPRYAPPTPRPSVAPSVGGQPEKHFHLQNKIPPPQGQRSDLRNVLAAVTKSPNLLNSEKLLEDHEEPHIEFHQATPQRTAPPPPNLPGVLSPPPPMPAKPYSTDPYRESLEP